MRRAAAAPVYELAEARTMRAKALASFPRNRLGEPPAWAVWVVTRLFPTDVERTCAFCSAAGITPAEARGRYAEVWARARLLSDLEFLDAVAHLDSELRGLRKGGLLLAPFELEGLPEFQRADAEDLAGRRVYACAPCAERETKRLVACGP